MNRTQAQANRKIREAMSGLRAAMQTASPKNRKLIAEELSELRDIKSGAEEIYRLVGEATGEFEADIIEVTPNSPMGLALMTTHGISRIHSRAASPIFFPDTHSRPHTSRKLAESAARPDRSIRRLTNRTPERPATQQIGRPTAIASSSGLTSNHFHTVRTLCS